MDELKFLLVAEGPTDIKFIEQLCRKISSDVGKDVKIQELSPQIDATSSNYPPHGWTAVRKWCLGNRSPAPNSQQANSNLLAVRASRKNWKALLSISKADGLIIQIDSDIAEHINDLPLSFVNSGKDRRSYCGEALSFWMNEDVEESKKIITLISTYSLETWLLATHNESDEIFNGLNKPLDYESISNVEALLVAKGYRSKSLGANRGRKLTKRPKDYPEYANEVYANLRTVRLRCPELDRFVSQIEST